MALTRGTVHTNACSNRIYVRIIATILRSWYGNLPLCAMLLISTDAVSYFGNFGFEETFYQTPDVFWIPGYFGSFGVSFTSRMYTLIRSVGWNTSPLTMLILS